MPVPLPQLLRENAPQPINRAPSPALALTLPWLMVMLGSLSPLLPLIASAPVVPPFGFLTMLAWQQLRPRLFPVWAGFPLGLFDDLYSGQPFGSAAVLWSLAILVLDLVEYRVPWRNFLQNWVIAVGLLLAYALLAASFANVDGGLRNLTVLGPQLVLSVLLMPLLGRIAALADRVRLLPLRRLD
ncbi:MAG: rod shape-determining protein MreD [Novosphingobium sp.]